jgi:hypothetical protein
LTPLSPPTWATARQRGRIGGPGDESVFIDYWKLQADGERDRLNAVLWFLFAAVMIDESKTPVGTFDYSRISIGQNTF